MFFGYPSGTTRDLEQVRNLLREYLYGGDYASVPSVKTLRSWCEQGDLVAVKDRRRWRVTVDSVHDLICRFRGAPTNIPSAVEHPRTPLSALERP